MSDKPIRPPGDDSRITTALRLTLAAERPRRATDSPRMTMANMRPRRATGAPKIKREGPP